MKTAFFQLVSLGLWLSSCTAHDAATNEARQLETTKPNVEIFRCVAANGSYHPLIIIEREEGDADSADDRDDDKSVRILFSATNTGLLGTCDTSGKDDPKKAKFVCKTGDQSIRLTWPTADVKSAATVSVEEKWLLGMRRYTTKCQAKG
jgi:hypothetical protein